MATAYTIYSWLHGYIVLKHYITDWIFFTFLFFLFKNQHSFNIHQINFHSISSTYYNLSQIIYWQRPKKNQKNIPRKTSQKKTKKTLPQ